MSSSANSSSTIAKIKESNQVSSGTTAKPAKDSESPPLIGTTTQIAEVPSYLNGNGFAAEDDTLTTISGTAIKGQSPQLKAIDSKLRLEPAEAVTISSYLRSDNGIGERAAEQGASEIASNAAMVQPRLTESTAAQPIRDFLTAETAAAATYEEIISQQRQGITAQANQSQLRVLQLLK